MVWFPPTQHGDRPETARAMLEDFRGTGKPCSRHQSTGKENEGKPEISARPAVLQRVLGMINLPFPPTTNSLTGVHNGRKIKSKRYREWESEAGWAMKEDKDWWQTVEWAAKRNDTPYRLEITLERPRNKDGSVSKVKRDLDNCVKAISDLLVAHGITPDDSLMQSLTVRWADAVEGPTVKVRAG